MPVFWSRFIRMDVMVPYGEHRACRPSSCMLVGRKRRAMERLSAGGGEEGDVEADDEAEDIDDGVDRPECTKWPEEDGV